MTVAHHQSGVVRRLPLTRHVTIADARSGEHHTGPWLGAVDASHGQPGSVTSIPPSGTRPLDAGPYTYVWVDGLTMKVREGGRIVNIVVVVATGVNANGNREVLGLDVVTSEDGGLLARLPALPGRQPTGRGGIARCFDAIGGVLAACQADRMGALGLSQGRLGPCALRQRKFGP